MCQSEEQSKQETLPLSSLRKHNSIYQAWGCTQLFRNTSTGLNLYMTFSRTSYTYSVKKKHKRNSTWVNTPYPCWLLILLYWRGSKPLCLTRKFLTEAFTGVTLLLYLRKESLHGTCSRKPIQSDLIFLMKLY